MLINRVLLAHPDPAVQELATRALGRLGVSLDIDLAPTAITGYTVIAMARNDALLAMLAALPARPRPVVIVTTDDGHGLDPDLVSLVVPEPYDAQTLVGVILACVTPEVPPTQFPLPDESGRGLG